MEMCLKTNVFLNDTIFADSLELPIDVDFTLPDYRPDISKIFKCRAVPRIFSKGVNGKTVTIEGSVCITLLYADCNSKIYSFEYQYPFQKNLELSEEAGNVNIKCSPNLDYIHCRAVSGRKVDIHGALSISITLFQRKCREIVSDYESKLLELKKGTAPATVPMGYAEKYLSIEDNIVLGQNKPNVHNILRYEANPCIKETKLVNEKAVIKGELLVCVLYTDEDCTVHNVKTVIPFSQIVDIEGVTEQCQVDTKCELCYLEIRPQIQSEENSLSLNAKLLFVCEAYCPNDVAVIFDAFSRKFKAEIKKENVSFSKIAQNLNDVFTCKNTIDLSEAVTSVVDIHCEICKLETSFETGTIKFEGSANFGIIALTEQNEICYFEGEIPFCHKFKYQTDCIDVKALPQIEVLSCNYTFMSDTRLEITCELQLNSAIVENNTVSLITDISLDDECPVCQSGKTALTVYFAGKNETAWDIARSYNASVDEIISLNDLVSDVIPEGKMLLIPVL